MVQLNKKHDFLSSARALIDLCAAPGGWLQVAAKYMPVSSVIIGVDLVPIKPIHNVITLQEDITTPRCRAAIKKHLQHWNADVVICDGAPNMGKAWIQDAYTQVDLVLKALKLATDFLRPGGTFVTKVFRSADYNALLWVFHQFFKKVEATKPQASRNTSAEIYVVCTHYLAPDKIDPRLLDSKHVFKELDMPLKKPDIFAPVKKKVRANQSGYEEGNYTLFKTCSVVEFIEAKDPVGVLASYNQMAFDDGARALKLDQHASTEIKACCQDLKVLNKKDFKNLLKWRLRARSLLHPEEAEEKKKLAEGLEDVEVAPITREEMEEQLDKELEDKMSEIDRKKKREKKKERERKAKLRQRAALGMETPGDGGVQEQEVDLFSAASVLRKDAADLLLDQAPDDVLESPEDSEEENEWAGKNYDSYLDHQLDSMYTAYVERTKKRAPPTEPKKKFRMGDDADELPEDERFDGDEEDEEYGERRVRFDVDDGEDEMEEETHRPAARADAKKAKQAALWFSRGIFQDVGAIEDGEPDESEDDEEDHDTEVGGRRAATSRGQKRAAADDDEEDDDDDDEDTEQQKKVKRARKEKLQQAQQGGNPKKKQKKQTKLEEEESAALDEFEEVPVAPSDSDSSDSSEAEPESDLDEVAATLAIGKKFFLTKKRKREFEDDGYNRYAFDDRDELPPWFVQDENRHNKPQKPITKEEVEEMKAKFRELNERPIKKVAEAKARKHLRMQKKVEKMKQKAAKIATADGMSEREKIKSIRTLQKHTLGKAGDAKAAPVYIVRKKHQTAQSQKGPSAGKKAKVKIVDPRLKKDKRGEKRASDKKRGSKGKGGKKRR